ncbi:hypothetical protein [Natronomonas sp. LN261]|uniref:hypothetical protein n=1 Tax=Natronomonas sp. LN261 TaxID=2750669 RepID=UPI0015EFA8A7|nr:hypothetical protein [Natronomonas sp. LN261]
MKKPDQDQIEKAKKQADKTYNIPDGSMTKAQAEAQLIFTQQLIADIQDNTEAVAELESTMDRYATWSRALTIILVILSALTLIEAAGIL